MNSIENQTQSAVKINQQTEAPSMPVYREPIVESSIEEVAETSAKIETKKEEVQEQESTETKIKNSFFDKYVTKIKDFLDNAE